MSTEWDVLYGTKKKDLNARDHFWATFDIVIEIGRILVSSLLVVFVPQDCGSYTCTIKENFEELTNLNETALGINFITLGFMMIMYGIIYKREKFLIYHMDETGKLPKTNCDEVFKQCPEIDYGFRRYNKLLFVSAIISSIFYVLNMILSAVIIFGYFYDGYQSVVQYLVNCALCISILYRSIVHSRSNLALSNTSFLPIAYNDVDKDYMSKKTQVEVVGVYV